MTGISLVELARNANGAAKTVDEVIKGASRAIGIIAVAGVKEHFATATDPSGHPWPRLMGKRPEGGSQKPLLDKGMLQNSVHAKWSGQDMLLMAGHVAANVHQFGAEIKAKRKFLALPLTVEAKRIGSPRKNKFPRALFFYEAASGNKFLAERDGNTLKLQYLLRERVKIPARPFLGYSTKTLDKITRLLANRMADQVASAFDPKFKPKPIEG